MTMFKMLVVDDDDLLRDMILIALERSIRAHEIAVTTATCVSDALEKIRTIEPNVVLTDLEMVEPSGAMRFGTEVVDAARAQSPTTFIALMSGRHEPLGHKADMFLHKPFRPERILEILATATEVAAVRPHTPPDAA